MRRVIAFDGRRGTLQHRNHTVDGLKITVQHRFSARHSADAMFDREKQPARGVILTVQHRFSARVTVSFDVRP